MNEAEIAEILEAYDLGDVRGAEPLDCDPRRPWKISTGRGQFVVRECRLYASAENLAFEHGLAAWLAERGLPAPRAVATGDGATWVESSGRFFAVYAYMGGEPFSAGNSEQAENAGACLASFHEVASAYEGACARRPAAGYRTGQRDAEVIRRQWPQRDEVSWLLEDFQRVGKLLFARPLPEALLFNDFSTGNVAFEDCQLSGVFDLECCFWGARLVDLANSLLSFSVVATSPGAEGEFDFEFDLACAKALLGGYESVQALSDQERRLLSTALRWQSRRGAVYHLADVQQHIGQWRAHEWDYAKRGIELVDATCEGVLE